MTLAESVRIGIDGLVEHRIRSVLTALGIIFGVAAVVAMLSIGEGARQEALEQIRLMGMNNIIIKAKQVLPASGQPKAKASFSTGLIVQDAEAIAEICPAVDFTVPHWENTMTAQFLNEQKEARVIGTTPAFLTAFGYPLAAGRFFEQSHLAAQANVCILGSDIRDALFRFESPIGKSLKVGTQWLSVIGVMGRRTPPGKKVENLEVRNLNMDIYVPITTAQFKMERFKAGGSPSFMSTGNMVMFDDGGSQRPVPKELLDQITVKLKDNTSLDEATMVIRRILERRHYGIQDYEIVVPEALVEQSQKTQQIFNVVMGAIAGISLLVGGIGIMNIMLASVMERTREIGVRRAVGATHNDVMGQFLFEATFLSVAGGFIGILLGFALTALITLYAGWRTVVSPAAIVLAFTVSAAVGISFGFYPARKAALQNPIDALRYE
ncbi:MAG TPA: ABC transporter permease [Bacteroidota bacterium]